MNKIADYDRKFQTYLKYDNVGAFVSCKTSQEMRQLVSLVRESQKTFGTGNHHEIQKYLKRSYDRCHYELKPVAVTKTERLVLDITQGIKTLTPATFEAVSNQLIDSRCWQNHLARSVANLVLESAMRDPKQTKSCVDLCFSIYRAELTSARTTFFASALLNANRENVDYVMRKELAIRSLLHRAYHASQMNFTKDEEFNLDLFNKRIIALASVSTELYRSKLISDKEMNALCSEIAGEWCDTDNLNGDIKLTGMNLLMINFGVALINGIWSFWSEKSANELPLHHYVAYLQKLKRTFAPKLLSAILKLEEKLFLNNVGNGIGERVGDPRFAEVTRF
uniref:Uncharacterized protein n=1 Tax=Panagrellus redivivus TaxID=6233 RepID=A0A7E4V315_PANRE